VLDDRALNKEFFVEDQRHTRTRSITSLDLIEEWHTRQIISDDERRSLRHRLRRAGAGIMPVDNDEIVVAALRSKNADSAELRAIHESISLARVAELPVFPAEIPWFASTTLAIKNAVLAIWQREPDHARAGELSNAVLALRPAPEDWLSRWEGPPPPDWMETVRTVILASLALPVELADEKTLKAYNTWLEQQVLEPLCLKSPKSYEAVVQHVRRFVDAVIKDDHD
jgi:hypothetical protein